MPRQLKACPICHTEMSTKNFGAHVKICKGVPPKKRGPKLTPAARVARDQEILEEKHYGFAQMLYKIIGKYPAEELYHIIWKPQLITSEAKIAEFKSKWLVVENIRCDCQGKRNGGQHHVHMLCRKNGEFNAEWLSKTMRPFFKEPQAIKIFPVVSKRGQGELTLVQQIRRLVDIIVYIQTKDGAHKKSNHQNPLVLANDNVAKKLRFFAFKTWGWSQVPYMQYLEQSIPLMQTKLKSGFVAYEKRERLQKKIQLNMDRLKNLQAVWGQKRDMDLELDLDEFMDYCDNIVHRSETV